jgi:hypothetical protein
MQTGGADAAQTLGRIAAALGRAGLPDNPRVGARADEAHQFLSRMIEAQASVMGFRESFLLITAGFFLVLVPAYFMRPRRPTDPDVQKVAVGRVGAPPRPQQLGSSLS